ncbi:NAD(P)-dependent oxidoreductase [Nocardia higoensis]|uniref:NAD(P)-dependent oxidoreductase n=1 Tax=Nocardia higoensis TaxID=228599 RepID=UPI0002DCDA74|nr:NAD(P)-dependent oxidoreductase [Nocardia higoensis]
MRIGFVGAGRMGRPMVARLVAAGHAVRVLGRSEGARAELADLGATPVDDLPAVAEAAEAVVVCVFTDDQVREVCLDGPLLSALPAGSVLIVHTTGSPDTATALAAATPEGVHVVDAPVSGGPHDIAAARLTVMIGGDERAVGLAQPVLSAYGDPLVHVGALGSGQRVKLVNNALFTAQIGLIAEAVRLGTALGVTEEALLSALPHASSGGRALASIAAKGSVAEFHSSVGEFVRKDVTVARALAADLGVDLGLLDTAIEAGAATDSAPLSR